MKNIDWKKRLNSPYPIEVGNVVPYYWQPDMYWAKILKIDGNTIYSDFFKNKNLTGQRVAHDLSYRRRVLQEGIDNAINSGKLD